jgi:N-acetylmuramic acid 6-phosphate etherase
MGINGGGTKTILVVVDDQLRVLGQVQTGPSNPNNTAWEKIKESLLTAFDDLLKQCGCAKDQIAAIGAGMAGVDRTSDQALFRQLFADHFPGVPLILENDGTVALVAGVGRRYGVITISGTGCITLAADHSGPLIRASGWGWAIDDGSGYSIGRAIIKAVVEAHDGMIPPTALTERLLTRLKIDSPTGIVSWIYAPNRNINEVAALASEAVALAEQDIAATRILVNAADFLAKQVITVIQRLNFRAEAIPVVLSGGIFDHCSLVRERFVQSIQTVIPNIKPMLVTREAALGAAMIAIHHLHPETQFDPGATPLPTDSRRATEQRNRLTMTISNRPTLDLLAIMNLEDGKIPLVISTQLPKIAELVDAIVPRFKQGGRIFLVGAGTSGRLAVLDAVELRPTFGVSPDQVSGILSGGSGAMMGAVEGAEDDTEDGKAQIESRMVGALDTVIGVAASGGTPFVSAALREARARGALTASIVNVVNAPISELVHHPLVAATGSEVITGSTRLRAGTAQKLLLNMISTGVMVKAGRTYHNLMTDMQANNLKLNHRAKVIVAEAAGISIESAAEFLEKADGEIKTAIACAVLKINPAEARAELSESEGEIRKLIG